VTRPPLVVVVAKSSGYRRYVEVRRDSLTLQLLAARDPTVASLRGSHDEHEATLERVLHTLRDLGTRMHILSVPDQPFDTRGVDLVVTVGGDGTLLGASHHVDARTPIVGVNSAPSTSVGFFCALKGQSVRSGLQRALSGKLPFLDLTRMEVRINGHVASRRVLNDALFCHASPAATSRYLVQIGDVVEEQKSSGFWIGPAAGSTAAQHSAGGKVLPLGSHDLQFVVREPFLFTGKLRFAHALVPPGAHVTVFNKMREARLFLDGPHTAINVGLGDRLRFSRSPETLRVLGLSRRRGRVVP
jgi:NAD+ kinase